MRIRNLAWPLLGLLVMGAGKAPTPGHSPRQEAACREMMAADREFSRITGAEHLAGFRKFLDDSVGTLRPNSPVIYGIEDMAKRWRFLENPRLGLEWTPIYAQSSEDGTFGFTVGTAQFREQTEKGWEDAGTSKYVTIWRKHKDGSWKVLFDTGVQDAPPDTTKK